MLRWPSFLPIIDQKDAAKRIVDAIRCEQMFLLLPSSLYLLMAMKRWQMHYYSCGLWDCCVSCGSLGRFDYWLNQTYCGCSDGKSHNGYRCFT